MPHENLKSTGSDPRRPPGRLVAVAGRTVHYDVAGSGAPSIVLESGFPGGSSLEWGLVASAVAKFATVVTYDRAGIGWSSPGASPRTAERAAVELRALLAAIQVPAPLVLVGHSGGGLVVRIFQQLYPDLVGGLVLLDASHEDQLSRIPNAWLELRRMRRELSRRLWLARFQAAGPFVAGRLARGPKRLLPSRVFASCVTMEACVDYIIAARAEVDAVPESLRFLREFKVAQVAPTIVLTRGRDLDPRWAELQAELAGAAPGSVHRTLPGIGHAIHLEAPAEVVRAVREIAARALDGAAP